MIDKVNAGHHHGHHHGHDHDTENHESCVALVPIFNHLEQSQMDEIMAVTHSVSYRKGEYIYRAGEESDSLYIVSRGRVKIYRLSESGKEQLLRILNPGDFTGELALFSETIHEAYACAMEDTSICTVRRQDLQKLQPRNRRRKKPQWQRQTAGDIQSAVQRLPRMDRYSERCLVRALAAQNGLYLAPAGLEP